MRKRKIFISDLDDTLYLGGHHDYGYAILRFIKLMLDELGHKAPHVTHLHKLFDQIDKERVYQINPKTNKPFLYSMDRFPGSMVECYERICLRAGLLPNQYLIKKIERIGYSTFNRKNYKKKGLAEGAVEVLNFLHQKGCPLILLTRGDERVQSLKIEELGLRKWFKYVSIIESAKTKEIFLSLLCLFDPKKSDKIYSVGNCFKSDIEPALEAGLRAIYIPWETWETEGEGEEEKAIKKLDRNRVKVFKEIIEIKNRYKEL